MSPLELLQAFWPLLVVQLGLAGMAIVDIVKRKQVNHLSKPVWILISMFISTIGPILYFTLGRGDE